MTEAETCPPRGIFNNEATGTVTGVREALSGRWRWRWRWGRKSGANTAPENIAMENGPLEDVFPIKNGDIPASYVSLLDGILSYPSWN